MWEVRWVDPSDAGEPLAEGWEPFAVSCNPYDRVPTKIWLRRKKS